MRNDRNLREIDMEAPWEALSRGLVSRAMAAALGANPYWDPWIELVGPVRDLGSAPARTTRLPVMRGGRMQRLMT